MSDKEIIVLVGISGSGKTTLRNELLLTHPNYAVHSWDALRQEFYRRRSGKTEFPAEEAFQYIAADEARNKEFRRYAETVFANLLRREVSIIVDNTNISPKRRQRYVDAARAYGYKLRAYVFNTPLEVCLERQKSRGPDTWVPESSVLQQYSLLDMGGLSKHFQSVTYIPNADGLDLQGINRRAGPTFNIYDSEQLRDWVIKNPKLIRINESR